MGKQIYNRNAESEILIIWKVLSVEEGVELSSLSSLFHKLIWNNLRHASCLVLSCGWLLIMKVCKWCEWWFEERKRSVVKKKTLQWLILKHVIFYTCKYNSMLGTRTQKVIKWTVIKKNCPFCVIRVCVPAACVCTHDSLYRNMNLVWNRFQRPSFLNTLPTYCFLPSSIEWALGRNTLINGYYFQQLCMYVCT